MASVVALSLVQTYYLLKEDFDELVEDSPDVRNYLQIVAERRVRDAYKRTHSEKSMVGGDALNDVCSVHDGLSSAESLAAAKERSQQPQLAKKRSFTTSSSASSELNAALAAAGAHGGTAAGPTTQNLLNPRDVGSNINLMEYVETGAIKSRKSAENKAAAAQSHKDRPHLRHAVSANSTSTLENALADMEKVEQVCNPDALHFDNTPVDPATIQAVAMSADRMSTVEKRMTMLENSASKRHDDLTRMIQAMSQKLGAPQSRSNWEDASFGYEHNDDADNSRPNEKGSQKHRDARSETKAGAKAEPDESTRGEEAERSSGPSEAQPQNKEGRIEDDPTTTGSNDGRPTAEETLES